MVYRCICILHTKCRHVVVEWQQAEAWENVKVPLLQETLVLPHATTFGGLQGLEPQSPVTRSVGISAGSFLFPVPLPWRHSLPLASCSSPSFYWSPSTGPQAAALRLPGGYELLAAAAQSVGGRGQSPEGKATDAHGGAGCSGRPDCGPSGRGGLSQQVSEQAAPSSPPCLLIWFCFLNENKAFKILFCYIFIFSYSFAGLGSNPEP